VRALVAFPVAGTLLWFALWATRQDGFPFWPEPFFAAHLVTWIGFLAAALVTCSAVLGAVHRWGPRAANALVATTALAWVCLWSIHLAPGFLSPSFSVRAAARDLGRQLASAGVVTEHKAEGLFLDNDLEFRRLSTKPGSRPPQTLLVVFTGAIKFEALLAGYEPILSYDLYLPPNYRLDRPDPSWGACGTLQGYCATVYRRRGESAQTALGSGR
jgi:hypothetical protein